MPEPTVALSIQQPWAWLIVRPDVTHPDARALLRARGEIKDVENRTWWTRYRGELYIHAGQRFDQAGYEWVRYHMPDIPMPHPNGFPRGGLVGKAQLVDCVQEHASRWFSGPWGFELAGPEPMELVPMPGRLGLFPVEVVHV